ncbi:hypothetical protein HYU22_05375 [Candidatus Woesearchaeota archaeon]|nr:hypothetical protein [Candidatus Woesearchaeota archaeon]
MENNPLNFNDGKYDQDRITFHCGYADVPNHFLHQDMRALLMSRGEMFKRGIFGKRGGIFWRIDVTDYPSIFYQTRKVKFHDVTVPLYVQSFLKRPLNQAQGAWYSDHAYRQKEKDLAQRLQEDLEHFPLEVFYERLPKLKNITVDYNPTLESRAIAVRPRKVEFGSLSKKVLSDVGYVACTLLHELYHHVEWAMGQKNIQQIFQGMERWKTTFWGKTNRVAWPVTNNNEFGEVNTELAEILAALTMIRHPKILPELRPYHAYLVDQRNGQLHLFPEERPRWHDSHP